MIQSVNSSKKIAVFLIVLLSLSSGVNAVFGQISTLTTWTNVYHGTSTTAQTATVTTPSGSNANRVLIVAIASSRTSIGARTVSLSYGGQALTPISGDMATVTVQQHTQLYLLNEAGIDAAANSTLSFTVSGGTTRVTDVFAAVFDGVDQVLPATDAATYSSGTSSTSNPVFSPALNVNAYDQAIEIVSSMRIGNTTPRTINSYATNWSLATDQTWTTTDGVRNSIAYRSIPTTNTTDASSTTFSGTALGSMTGISLRVIITSPGIYSAAGSYQFNVPVGVTCLQVETWGGGGSGSTLNTNGNGGGGGGGAYSRSVLSVVPGNSYNFYVGAGSTTITNGEDSYFINSSTLMAKGGGSVANNTATGATGGSANSGVGDFKKNGGRGADGSGTYGGGGGSSAGTILDGATATNQTGATAPSGGGNGGNGISGTQGNGSNGSSPGGGGGGSYKTGPGTRTGGSGADGKVIIDWVGLSGTNTPVVSSPIYTGATSISGSSEANANIVVFAGGSSQIGTGVSDGSGAWNVAVSAVTLGQSITATAKSIDKCLSAVSNSVTVIASPTIATGTITPLSFCPGSAVSVPYTKTGNFNSGNVFTAQLSDAGGSFASPTTIGTLTSQISGSITATIPAGQATGSGYRIRVVSSNPVITGSDNGSDIYIGQPGITVGFPGSSCGAGAVTLSATATPGAVINWYAAATGGTSLGTGPTFITPAIAVTTTYYIDATLGSCTSAPRVAVIATVVSLPAITAGGGGIFCAGSTISLTSTGTNISNQYWTGPNNFYSVDPNPVITLATAAMSGTYTVIGSAISGTNMVANGDFELGNTGFGSGYTLGTDLVPEGRYAVVADPHSVHANYSSCADHTDPPGTLQMVVNGSIVAGVTVWSQTVNISAGTDYQFTYWVQSVVALNPSQLQLFINGIAAGPIYTALLPTCQWKQFIYNWNSGSSTTAFLDLQNQNTIASGNDFALDDIAFKPVCTAAPGDFAIQGNSSIQAPLVSSSVVVTVNADVTAGSIGANQSICQGFTPATLTSVTAGSGSGVITYEWQTNASGSFVTIIGATAATYSPPSLATTTIYQRRTVSVSGGITCYSPYSNQITITITGPTVVAGGPNTVCQAASPTAITLSGASYTGGTGATWSIFSGTGTLS
ncbi:MAG: hypothetical protein WCI92_16710, partial [Bacteroidota bacterium]